MKEMNGRRQILILFSILMSLPVAGQKLGDLKLVYWKPESQLVVKETRVVIPKFPVIDIHNHLRRLENTEKYLKEMDKAGVWICVGLDGHSKDDLYKEHLEVSHKVSKERFYIFFSPENALKILNMYKGEY
ncbi:MAG: hypothetical protein KFF73_01230 [Cyclobacteriaceae bacterium]|nr:hypothetical protein [Cyclobacteriaceae bacterium]